MGLEDFFINLAYIIFLVALVVRDVLWLRVIMTIASFSFVAYALLVGSASMIAWNVLFTGINIFQIILILRERRPVELSPDLEKVQPKLINALKISIGEDLTQKLQGKVNA